MLADRNIPDTYWLLLFVVPSGPQAAILIAWIYNLLLLFVKAHNPKNITHFPTIFFCDLLRLQLKSLTFMLYAVKSAS